MRSIIREELRLGLASLLDQLTQLMNNGEPRPPPASLDINRRFPAPSPKGVQAYGQLVPFQGPRQAANPVQELEAEPIQTEISPQLAHQASGASGSSDSADQVQSPFAVPDGKGVKAPQQ